ncbi:hypothetical protein Tco_1552017, partial [Tanacetum coccineum]
KRYVYLSTYHESTADYSASTTDRDCRVASSRPHPTCIACGDTDTIKDTADTGDRASESAGTRWRSNTARDTRGGRYHDSGTGVRRQAPPARECTYPDFMKSKPLYFKGTEGVVELTQWFERMETVFSISNCSMENQIKFSTCTLLGSALTWWNSHVRTIGHNVVYVMTWADLKKNMTDKYCLRGEIKKLEAEL